MYFKEIPLVEKAITFAQVSLADKKRKSGESFVDHCVKVAEELQRMRVDDPPTLAAAILHHTISDSAATSEDIQAEFGEDIAQMVKAFESLRIIRLAPGGKDEFAENLRKMFMVLARDLRVVVIKMIDIFDNLTTLEYLEFQKKEEVARETLEIFAPMADRLGMGEIKGQMQNLAFKHLHPKEYEWVKKYSDDQIDKLTKAMPKVKNRLSEAFIGEDIRADIQSRIKHVYSLYTKLMRPENNCEIGKIYDLMAMRVIVEGKEDCYRALGVINKILRPVEGEQISDYIAHPKTNGYQSIHIKVMGPSNIPFEIQIRTRQMHEEAEYGLAAHWNYAEKKASGLSDEVISKGFAASAEKLEWVKRLSQWQEEITDNQEFLKTVTVDFFGQRIFCFTPKGDVKDLPVGATPIDFAYYVHTDLGNRVKGAKVNGRVVTLNSKLKNADVVELSLSKDPFKKPSRDWLRFVVTTNARKKIKRALQVI